MTGLADWPIWITLPVLVLAAWRVTRVVVGIDGFHPVEWLRVRLLARWPAEETVFPDDESIEAVGDDLALVNGRVTVVWSDELAGWVPLSEHWVGKLLTCPACAGFWVGAAVWVGWLFKPGWTVALAVPFAFSALIWMIHLRVDG